MYERADFQALAGLLRNALPDRLSRSAEVDLVRAARAGNAAARTELVRRQLRLVVHVARRYGAPGLLLEDLVHEGLRGLLKAVDAFDEDRGLRFGAYAVWWIRSTISSATRAARNRSKLESLGQETDAFEDPHLHAAADGGAPSLADQVMHAEIRGQVRRELRAISARMGRTARAIVEHRLIADDPSTLQAIGDRLGLTRERIRQVEAAVSHELLRRLSYLRTELGRRRVA